ncbi:MAG: hypothetical protein RSA07_08115 [Erysipelotrichaceae bacterium]
MKQKFNNYVNQVFDNEEGVAYFSNCDDDHTQHKIEKLPLDDFIEEEM